MAWSETSRHQRGYGTAWDKLRRQILARDKHLCQTCLSVGKLTQASQVDHVTPKSRGGTDAPNNLAAICKTCHETKTAKEAAEAQGRRYRPRVTIGPDGWPTE